FRLALCRHARTHEQRRTIMTVERKYSLDAVMEALEQFKRRITFEYVMIAGLNDSSGDAEKLAEIAQPLGALVNLLPLHDAGTPGLVPSGPERMKEFAQRLEEAGVSATVSRRRGLDIDAACVQL